MNKVDPVPELLARAGSNRPKNSAIDSRRNGTRLAMIEAMVCGYHVYKEIWCAAVGEELSCMREVENYRDPFAVAVVRSGVIVDHVPRKIYIVGMFNVFKTRWDYQLQSYRWQTLF